jgi:FkbM family methyltransferase
LEFHGNCLGGWCTTLGWLGRDAVVVDVGLGEDTSFAESIIERYGCVVYGFDPTPRSIAHVNRLGNDKLRLFELGVGPTSGRAEFFLPINARHVSGSIAPERHLAPRGIQVELISVDKVFQLIERDRIHLLKLDIEGAEYDTIESPAFRYSAPFIDQLCVEFHHRWPSRGRRATDRAVATLRSLGFACAWTSPTTNEEFLFVRRAHESSRP